jgi:hypothetical protein
LKLLDLKRVLAVETLCFKFCHYTFCPFIAAVKAIILVAEILITHGGGIHISSQKVIECNMIKELDI